MNWQKITLIFILIILVLIIFKNNILFKNPYNVVFISIDDLVAIPLLEQYADLKIPNIDKLRKMGLTFNNAHAAASLCNPSRTAVITGKAPYTTGIYDNSSPSNALIDEQKINTLMDSFKQHGYTTISAGKIQHHGMELPNHWDKQYDSRELERFEFGDWGVFDKAESEMDDYKVVTWAKSELQNTHTPYFLAIGLRKPHTAWVVPQKYFDLYPLENIKPPISINGDLTDAPQIIQAIIPDGLEDYKLVKSAHKLKEAIQAYLASVSFMDARVGDILTAIENSPEAQNTIIILWSDQGYHLGTKSTFKKRTLWEEVTKVPLIIYVPRMTHGESCSAMVNLLDIYPTLIELCHLAKVKDLDGHSLVRFIKNPHKTWDYPSITTNAYKSHAINDGDWKYIRYINGEEELYNLKNDPDEINNLANDQKYQTMKTALAKKLPEHNHAPTTAPLAMKWIPAGFWMDDHEITNYEFNNWARAIQYKTEAELLRDPEPGSLVFKPDANISNLSDYSKWWKFTPGAEWKHPQGPGSSIADTPYNPVVQVSYNDAMNYCRAMHKRLATETEWQYAAGNVEIYKDGKWLINIFQGQFPNHNSSEDGFAGIAPIKSFPANEFGLYDMAGNVWEWVSSQNGKTMIKGGSYLCADHCRGFDPKVSLEMEAGSATDHIGFRCVQD